MVIPSWLNPYLKTEDLPRLEQTEREVEARTEAEIVPVIVRASSTYPQTIVTLVLTGLLMFSLFWKAFGGDTHWDGMYKSLTGATCGLLAILLGSRFLARIPVIQRLFTIQAEELEQCWKRAHVEFHVNRVSQTKDGIGVLVFISLLERQVIVLADKTISQKLPQETWQKVVDEITAGMKNKNLVQGLQKGLAVCSDLLNQHFPVKSGDVDELPNKIFIKD